jgi:2-oxoglutarate ferredoxin oxidoreductase subunit beta
MKTSGKVLADKVQSIERSHVFDVRSEELPTWCPGCGYFGIHQGLNSCIKELGLAYHEVVTVSGIGCAGRYPFFASTYGFHSVHGRAVPTAMGVKLGNPALTVYVVGGDGDGLAIGGGHLPHAARRDIDINYLLFDNSIYGLTKGQPSPSSPRGMKSKASPYGSPDAPLNASLLALSYGASFVARLFAGQPEAIAEALMQGTRHRGFSFFHILTSCVTFDKEFKTWENLNRGVHPLPANHDSSDWQEAVTLVARDDLGVGVLYHREEAAG